MKSQLFVAALSLLSAPSFAKNNGKYARRVKKRSDNGPKPQKVRMPVDHFNSSNTQTYENRFWVNDQFYKPGGPVVIYDQGESGVQQNSNENDVVDNIGMNSSNYAIVQQFNGLGVLWEHRYYGESLPFPINKNGYVTTPGGYQYLTIEQALEDVVYFANHFQPKGLKKHWNQLKPSNTPWIFIGGSYPGLRAALLRVRNPDTIFASWASSAPVQTSFTMPTYFEQAYMDLNANCSADMAAAANYFDSVLKNGSQQDGANLQFLTTVATVDQVAGINQVLNDSSAQVSSAIAQAVANGTWSIGEDLVSILSELQYGFFDGVTPVAPYCDLMEQYDPRPYLNASSLDDTLQVLFGPKSNDSSVQPSDRGIAATYGQQAAFGALLYATSIYNQYAYSGSSPNPPPVSAADGASWNWQSCTEQPNWQIASNNSQYNLLSSYVDQNGCIVANCGANSSFPGNYQGDVPPSNITVSRQYGGWNMQPSNVMFTDGLKDPWHTLSVQSTSSDIGAPNRTTTQNVPECNQPPSGTDVFGLLYPDTYHAMDLAGTPQSGEGVALFTEALNKWLPGFNASNHTQPPQDSSSSGVPVGTASRLAVLAGVVCVALGYGGIW